MRETYILSFNGITVGTYTDRNTALVAMGILQNKTFTQYQRYPQDFNFKRPDIHVTVRAGEVIGYQLQIFVCGKWIMYSRVTMNYLIAAEMVLDVEYLDGYPCRHVYVEQV